MRTKHPYLLASVIGMISVLALGMTLAPQDRSALKAPNGIALAEFKGYETWQVLAPHQTEDGLKAILGNTVMVKAYNDGIPANGKTVPDGAMMAKIEWSMKSNEASPYPVKVPDQLKSLSFMIKDSKRFPNTDGWGYAQFNHDPATKTDKPFGKSPEFAKTCHECHALVKERNFVFTNYAPR